MIQIRCQISLIIGQQLQKWVNKKQKIKIKPLLKIMIFYKQYIFYLDFNKKFRSISKKQMQAPKNLNYFPDQQKLFQNQKYSLSSPYDQELKFMNQRQHSNFIHNTSKTHHHQIHGQIYTSLDQHQNFSIQLPYKFNKTHHHQIHDQIYTSSYQHQNSIELPYKFNKISSSKIQPHSAQCFNHFQQNLKERNQKNSLFFAIGPELLKQFMIEGLAVYSNEEKFQRYSDLQQKIFTFPNVDFQSQILLLIYPKMFPLYKAYHKILSIQLQKIHQKTVYSIIRFKGIAYSGDSICFGIAVCQNITYKKAELILMKFQKEHVIAPQTVILSKDQKQLCETSQTYFRTYHPKTFIKYKQTTTNLSFSPFINDTNHRIYNYYTACITELQRKRVKKILSQICKNPNYVLKQYQIQKVFNYEHFYASNTFLSENVSFFGTNIDLVVKYINNSQKQKNQSLKNKINSIIKYQLQIIRKERTKLIYQQQFQKFYDLRQVYLIKTLLSRKTFLKFMLSLVCIPKLSINIAQPPHFYIVQSGEISNIVKFNARRAKPPLLCDCKMQQRTGLPCEHMMKVALIQQIQILDCIDQFWLIDQFNQEKYTVNRHWEVFQTKD